VSRSATIGALALIVSACGGSGNGAVGPPGGSYDLQTAMAAFVKTSTSVPVNLSGSVTANGTSVPFTGTGTLKQSAGVAGTFNGAPALLQTTSISGTVTAAGQSAPYSTSVVDAYDGSTAAILGESQSSEFDVASAPIMIPSAVGTSAMVLGTLSRYADSTQSVVLGTTQISVAVTQSPVDPGSQEVVQFTFKIYDTSQTLAETDTESHFLTADGVLSFDTGTANTASGTVTVTAQ
jgi:hypothetical protein